MSLHRRTRPVGLILAAIAFSALALLPFASVRFPPLNDYPFHLARIVILSGLHNPVFARFYTPGSFLLPDVALDAVAVPLAWIFGPEHAVRIFVEALLILTLAGLVLLNRVAHGNWSAWPLLGVGLLYNGIFRFGFLNYLFGLALALIATALWMHLRGAGARFAAALASCVILIFCHMEAFGVFTLAVAGVALDRAFADYRRAGLPATFASLCYAGAPFVLTLAAFVLLSPAADAPSLLEYAPGWGTKPFGQLFSLSTGLLWLDAAIVVLVAGLAARLWFKGWLSFNRSLAASTGLILLAAIALPPSLMGSLYADDRLGPAVALFALSALGLRSDAPVLTRRIVAGAAFALAALQAIVLSSAWSASDREIGSIVAALDKVPSGATLFALTAEPYPRLILDSPEKRLAWRPPVKHVASYAVLHAPVFVPMTFADPTKQPLVISPAYLGIKNFQSDNPIKVGDRQALAATLADLHDRLRSRSWPDIGAPYVLVMGRDRLEPITYPAWAEPVDRGDKFVLLRLEGAGRDNRDR
jgi:hypothetical protein